MIKKKTTNIIKSIKNIFKQIAYSLKTPQNQVDGNFTDSAMEQYLLFQESEDTHEEYEVELDDITYDYFERPPRTTPAANLPDGWVWVDYWDGSGSLHSPNDKQYFSYDLQTYEYDQYDNGKWSHWEPPMLLATFKDFAEKEMLKILCE